VETTQTQIIELISYMAMESSLGNVVFFSIKNFGQWPKYRSPEILSVIHHRQKPLVCTVMKFQVPQKSGSSGRLSENLRVLETGPNGSTFQLTIHSRSEKELTVSLNIILKIEF
jgi:hypothetical protein